VVEHLEKVFHNQIKYVNYNKMTNQELMMPTTSATAVLNYVGAETNVISKRDLSQYYGKNATI